MMPEELLFYAKIKDCARLSQKYHQIRSIGFYNEFESSDALQFVTGEYPGKFQFFGGYSGAVRKMLAFSPEANTAFQNQDFPIVQIRYTCKSKKNFGEIQHKDVLGTLMGLKISREKIGDLVIFDHEAIVFVQESVKDICLTIEKIAGFGVYAAVSEQELTQQSHNMKQCTGVIASMRLDCVVAQLCHVSREKAENMLVSGLVFLNGVIVKKGSVPVTKDDVVSVRKQGKFLIGNHENKTKKGRIVLQYEQYN